MTFRNRIGCGAYAELAGTPAAAHDARVLICDLLGDDHPSVHDAALIVSELVSNAIVHSRSGLLFPVIQDGHVGVVAGEDVSSVTAPPGLAWRGRGVRAGVVVVSLT